MKNFTKGLLCAFAAVVLAMGIGCSSDGDASPAFSAPIVVPVQTGEEQLDSITAVTTVSSWTEGDVVQASAITVTARYTKGTVKTITEGFTLSGDTTLKTGTNTITVTYNGKTTTLTITAKAKASGGEEEKTGTVSIEVTVDGKYKCGVCGTAYDTKAEAENCAHAAGCPGWEYTVTFKDAEGGSNATVTKKVKNGSALAESDIPAWKKDGCELSWSSSETGVTTASKITKDVTFTAVWTGLFTVKFVDSDGKKETVTKTIKSGAVVPASDVPAWTKDHYTLSWDKDVAAAITTDTTFTSVWTENAKFTVKFVDSAVDGIAAETDASLDAQTVYSGEKASLPAWASASRTNKKDYTVTWTSSVAGVTPTSAITQDVTFTASWSKTPSETVITFEKSGAATNTTIVSGASAKSYKTNQTYTTAAGTAIETTYGAKLNSTGFITLTLADSYTVLFVQGTDKTVDKGLNIATLGSDGSTYGDAVNYAVVSSGSNVVSASLSAGTYKITNGGSETSVFAIILQK